MLVLVQVSSIKTSRSGSMGFCSFARGARRRATSGRSRSPATTVFFKTQLLGMDELPDRAVIDLQPAFGEFGDKPAQGEVRFNPLQQPTAIFTRDRLRLVPAHL